MSPLTLVRSLAAPLALALALMTGTPAPAADLKIEDFTGAESLSGPRVQSARVAPDGSQVAFLQGSQDNRFLLDIWLQDRSGAAPRRLTDAARLQPHEQLSDAEKARRERARTAEFSGILDYRWSHDGSAVLFTLGGDLYLQPVAAGAAPRKLVSAHDPRDAVIDPAVSPKGRYVSFLRRLNLWILDLQTGKLQQFSHEGGGLRHAGEAEFVAQEEFEQEHGYWWAPDDSALVYKVVDESPVAVAHRLEVYADHAETVEQRYPAAGTANARVHLVVRDLAGHARSVPGSEQPDHYLVGVDWRPDARGFFYQRLNRAQNLLELIGVDWPTLGHRTLLEERSTSWVDVEDMFRPLEDGGFLWGSARTGWPQLYRYDAHGQLLGALTSGHWTIDRVLAVDEKAAKVFVSGNRDEVAGCQLYAVDLAPGGAVSRLHDSGGWHSAEFAEKGTLYIDTWSDENTPPRTALFDASGQRLAWLQENRLDESHPYWPHRASHAPWTYGTLTGSDGVALDYGLLKPVDFDPARRYPVVVMVYGGPHVQTVVRAWRDSETLFEQYLAQHGYLVFRLDNRGSARRGTAFANAIFRQLGTLEVQDQASGLDWLRAQPYVDGARIGVFGWSYGGYMSLMMQARLADRLAAGVVVAPVTDWALYDTAYTERYMGTPADNPHGYADSRVFPWLDGLRRPLLLIHGMADDNVLFSNSTALMAALQARNFQFDLMTYPGAKHGIAGPEARRHLFTRVIDFFDQHLQPGQPRATAP